MLRRTPFPYLLALLAAVGCLDEQRSATAIGTRPAPAPPQTGAASGAPETLRVHFLDIGQGDAAWVQAPGGVNVLVDGGPSAAGPKVIEALRTAGVGKLDWIVGTHPHEDHIGGLVDVLRELPVRQALDPGYNHGTALQRSYLELLKGRAVKTTRARAGQIYELGKGGRLEIVAPRDPLISNTRADANNNSIVLRLVYGRTRVLFTGDMEDAERERLLKDARPDQLRSQVLKVAHHGSHNGTDPAFLRTVAPEYAVISLGKGNDYGHPHRETLDELASAKVKVLRTDELGTITFESDGKTIRPIAGAGSSRTAGPAPSTPTPAAPPPAAPAVGGAVIANRNSKVYHAPNCPLLPAPANQVRLPDARQAEQQGYRPHRACITNR